MRESPFGMESCKPFLVSLEGHWGLCSLFKLLELFFLVYSFCNGCTDQEVPTRWCTAPVPSSLSHVFCRVETLHVSCMTESQHSPVHGCGIEQSPQNPEQQQVGGQRAQIPLLLAGHLPAAYKELQLITTVCPEER